MPLASVVLRQESSAKEKSEALRYFEQRPGSKNTSAAKAQILGAVIKFAKNTLVEAGPFDHPPALYHTCNEIFKESHLPDLLFLRAVIDTLTALHNDTSGLKKTVLPMAQNYKRPLIDQSSRVTSTFFHRDSLATRALLAVLPVSRNRFQPGT